MLLSQDYNFITILVDYCYLHKSFTTNSMYMYIQSSVLIILSIIFLLIWTLVLQWKLREEQGINKCTVEQHHVNMSPFAKTSNFLLHSCFQNSFQIYFSAIIMLIHAPFTKSSQV